METQTKKKKNVKPIYHDETCKHMLKNICIKILIEVMYVDSHYNDPVYH